MKKEYTVKQMAGTRWFYTFTESNAKGETLTIELSLCTNWGGSHALPILWKQHGYIDRVLETYWCISTYAKDTEGNCYGRYNPQDKLSEDGKRAVINFDWMFEATEENREKLIDEAFRLFSIQVGETATEIKKRKVIKYAKENNVELYDSIPEGWFDLGYGTAPMGSRWIGNYKSFKEQNKQKGLLVLV